jgi:organic hydroperoxide reductase OsmC/OhrA
VHTFRTALTWTGNLGSGTSSYRTYSRNHEISGEDKTVAIPCCSDPVFRGDKTKYNPEELLVASLASCHMLWMLHLCAESGIIVTAYEDHPVGTMVEHPDGSGEFTRVVLRPRLTLADPSRAAETNALHARAHGLCFIARSVNFEVRCEPEVSAAATDSARLAADKPA